jgi:signal transduction histidine kinase
MVKIRKLNAILLLMLLVPSVLMAWLGWRSVRMEQARLHDVWRETARRRLSERQSALTDVCERLFRELQEVLAACGPPTDAEGLRHVGRTHRLVRQIFITDANHEPVYPAPGSALLTDGEKGFLVRTAGIWASGETFATAEDESAARAGGWHAWFRDDGIHWLVWRARPAGGVIGAEVDRFALLAEAIAALPHTPPPDDDEPAPTRHRERFVLSDPRGATLYQWGAFEPAAGAVPLATRALAPPLAAWQLAFYAPPWTTGVLTPTAVGLLAALAGTFLLMALATVTVRREHTRALREARQRVSFVNQVSHELKTPLTNIRLYAELLQRRLPADDAKAARFLDVVLGESRRLGRMIANVLTFAQQGRGALRPRPAVGVPDETVRATLDVFRPALAARDMPIALTCRADRPMRFDRDFLEQILGNLLSNAEKYAGRQACITVETAERDGFLEVVVSDSGPGIPRARRADVFRPFVRLDNRVTEGTTGVGIGLAIARDLARRHGGDLTLEAGEGGARFKIVLGEIA